MRFLPEKTEGMKRKYYRCSHCKQVQAHDFVPYGLGTMDRQYNPCMCQLTGHNTNLLKEISAEEFYKEFNGEVKTNESR